MNIQQFGARAGDGSDTTPAVRAALEALQGQKDVRLVFPPGRYDFWPDRASEEYLFICNNDESLKRIAFLIDGSDGLEIDGQGSHFVFHSLILPFVIRNSQRVRLSHFSLDWARPFTSEARVLESRDGSVDLFIPESFPYKIEHQQLVFTGEGTDTYGLNNALEFDPARRETAFRVFDNYGIRHWHRAEEIGPRCVRLEAKFANLATPGNVLVLIDGNRYCPGISAMDSRDIEVENVTLHHCGGMGFIAQRCRDLRVRDFRVAPEPGSGRLISATADATHFVNCGGHIELENCRFENQLDDPTNVHGVYAQITQRLSDHEIEVRLVHHQQLGVRIADVGDEIGFVGHERLETYHTARVSEVKTLNKVYTRLKFETPLPPEVLPPHVIENHEWQADVTIRGCTSRGNRARGFLLSTAGRVLVENNTFHTPGAAILIAGDANYWFESGAARDITIRGNHFDNCLYGVWGRAVIDICPEIEAEFRATARFHRNITIENNHFRAFDGRLLRAEAVDGLTVRSNQIEFSTDYPQQPPKSAPFDIEDCSNVVLENNSFPAEMTFAPE